MSDTPKSGSDSHHIYLVPGFFGFANIGEMRYFQHVRDALEARASAARVNLRIHDVFTHPTGSLQRRASRLLDDIASTAGFDSAPIHIIAHSTGGIDSRVFLAAGATLPSGADRVAFAARVRTVVTIASPHQGTPLLSAFTGLQGRRILRMLSVGMLRLVRAGALDSDWVKQVGAWLGQTSSGTEMLIDDVVRDVLAEEGFENRRDLEAFFHNVQDDHNALLVQLQPEAMHLFNALVPQPPGVRCGSVVAAAPGPTGIDVRSAGLNARKQASLAIFGQLHRLAGAAPRDPWVPPTPAQRAVLDVSDPILTSDTANDGLVPTASQVWGDVIAAAVADHMDVLGHFAEPGEPPSANPGDHKEWLYSAAGFDRRRFDAIWDAVFAYVFGDVTR